MLLNIVNLSKCLVITIVKNILNTLELSKCV